MMSGNPPPARAIQHDLAFWSGETRLLFLMRVSDILELKQDKHREAVEKVKEEIFGQSWVAPLEPELQNKIVKDSAKKRQYDETLVRDLLRVIRNLSTHNYTLAPELRTILGRGEDLSSYWVRKFPLLLPAIVRTMQEFAEDTNCRVIKHFYI